MSHINKVSRAENMLDAARDLVEDEKEWMMSVIGLIDECDDDVMDEVGRFSSFFFEGWGGCLFGSLTQSFLFLSVYSKNGARVPGSSFENS